MVLRTTGELADLLTTTAEGWFPRLGFVRVDRARVPAAVQLSVEFTAACPASAVVMWRAPDPSKEPS